MVDWLSISGNYYWYKLLGGKKLMLISIIERTRVICIRGGGGGGGRTMVIYNVYADLADGGTNGSSIIFDIILSTKDGIIFSLLPRNF